MELMDNTTNISHYVPKIIEFPEHFVMNSQLYDKQTLKPVPMRFHTDNTGTPFIVLQTSIDKTNYWNTGSYQFQFIQNNNEHNYQNIIQDKTDPSVFYAHIKYRLDNNYLDIPHIIKMQYDNVNKKYTKTNIFNIRNVSSPSNYNHKGDIKILYENDRYFVIAAIAQYGSSGTFSAGYTSSLSSAIGLLDKKSFTYTSISSSWHDAGTGCNLHLLEANDDIVYILAILSNGKKIVYKLNTSTQILSTIWTQSGAPNVGCCCNPVKIGDFYYLLSPHLESGVYSYKIMKISLNTTDDTVSADLLDINLNSFILDNSSTSNLDGGICLMHTLRVIQTSTNTYLSLLTHCVPNMTNSWHYQHKHALLKSNDSVFDVVDVISLTDGCFGSLENGDSKHQIWYMSNCALFYSFDETKEKMTCTYRKGGVFMQIGFDSLNRFIVQYADRSIEMLTNTNACILKADFDEDLYDKDDSSKIDTTISFYAKNYSDEYLETNVKLTLIGPVIFKENNSKELIISTLKTGLRTVPVVITGYGNIEVVITQNT